MRVVGAIAALSALAGAGILVACGIDESGLAVDGGQDVVAEATSEAGCSACSGELAAGWKLVLLGSSDASCPSSHTATTVVSDASAASSACACACNSPPSSVCANGTFTLQYGSGTCGNTGAPQSTNAGACTQVSGTLVANYQVAFAPSFQCTPEVIVDDAGLSGTAMTVCEPFFTCEESTCSGSPPAGFFACIENTGDQACPAGAFQQRTVVGLDPSLSCSNGCSCANTLTCGGTFTYFADSQCDAAVFSVGPSNGCIPSGNGGTAVRSERWDGTLLDGGCAPQGISQATIGFTSVRTLCCR